MNLDQLHQRYALTPETFTEIQQQIIGIFTHGIIPAELPIAILLGGQPGSGKGELTTFATDITGNNTVICNADDLRDFHPNVTEIKSSHETSYPEITVKYSQPWNNGLRAFCEEHHLNYIMETTFSSGERMNQTIAGIKEKGYRVIILLLAVDYKFSLLGTQLRYYDMKTKFGFGRLVSRAW